VILGVLLGVADTRQPFSFFCGFFSAEMEPEFASALHGVAWR
jgi:hypothetical protein